MNYGIGPIKKSRGKKGLIKATSHDRTKNECWLVAFIMIVSVHCVTEEMLGDKKRDDYISVVVPLPRVKS